MASVRLKAIWLSDADNPADYLALRLVRSFRKNEAITARVVNGAGGRRRLISRPGRDVSWSLTFGTTTPAEKEWITAHIGRLLCVRDNRGGKVFGAYLQVPWDERTWSHDAENVQLDIVELTYSEAV